MRGRRITVYDVAARAGVSIATVSFAFTQPSRVRKSTLDAVLAAARALGYVPSANARGLASGRTGAIGLYSFDYLPGTNQPSPTAPDQPQPAPVTQRLPPPPGPTGPDIRRFPLYVDEVQWGAQLECRQRGYALMLGAGHNPGHLPAVIDIAGRVDGLIALTTLAPPEAITQVSKRIPVVELGRGTPRAGIHTVPVDNRGGMRALTEHLIGVHGYRRLTYLGEQRAAEFVARYKGFSMALSAAGLPIPEPVYSHPSDALATADAVERCLRAGDLPEAFVCTTDQEALTVVDALTAAGVDVPSQAAVTGFDGTLAGQLQVPRLTTVRQPLEAIGRAAVRILADLLDGSSPSRFGHSPLATTLVLGSSCGCSPTDQR